MKRLTVIILVIAGILCVASPAILDHVTLFILVGAIPGTSWSVPPLVMLAGLAAILLLVIGWLRKQEFRPKTPAAQPVKAIVKTSSKKTVTKRRSSAKRSPTKRRLARQTQTA